MVKLPSGSAGENSVFGGEQRGHTALNNWVYPFGYPKESWILSAACSPVPLLPACTSETGGMQSMPRPGGRSSGTVVNTADNGQPGPIRGTICRSPTTGTSKATRQVVTSLSNPPNVNSPHSMSNSMSSTPPPPPPLWYPYKRKRSS
eukprot:sb/3473803/